MKKFRLYLRSVFNSWNTLWGVLVIAIPRIWDEVIQPRILEGTESKVPMNIYIWTVIIGIAFILISAYFDYKDEQFKFTITRCIRKIITIDATEWISWIVTIAIVNLSHKNPRSTEEIVLEVPNNGGVSDLLHPISKVTYETCKKPETRPLIVSNEREKFDPIDTRENHYVFLWRMKDDTHDLNCSSVEDIIRRRIDVAFHITDTDGRFYGLNKRC